MGFYIGIKPKGPTLHAKCLRAWQELAADGYVTERWRWVWPGGLPC